MSSSELFIITDSDPRRDRALLPEAIPSKRCFRFLPGSGLRDALHAAPQWLVLCRSPILIQHANLSSPQSLVHDTIAPIGGATHPPQSLGPDPAPRRMLPRRLLAA